jgi:hypothetical protein
MRASAIAREAWLNARTGAGRTLLLALIVGVVGIGFQAADVAEIRSIAADAHAFQAAGANVRIVALEGGVDPLRCDSLSSQPGVEAAGAIRTAADVSATSLPHSTLPAYDVTPGFVGVVAPDASHDRGVLVSEDLATTLGVSVSDDITLVPGRSTSVAGVYSYPTDGRQGGLGYALLAPTTDTQAFDACWVREWPLSDTTAQLLRGVTVPATGANSPDPEYGQLNSTLGTSFDAAGTLASRLSRWAPAIAWLVAAIASHALTRLRRLEFASDRHMGVSRSDLVAIVGLETLMATVPVVLVSAGAAAVLAAWAGTEGPVAVMGLAWLSSWGAMTGALTGTLTAVVRVRERHVMTLFKER